MTSKNIETKIVTAGRKARFTMGAVNPVIQRASSLVFESVEAKKAATANRAKQALFYGRRGTTTHFAFQDAMCELENGAGCYLYPCGAAAVSNAILAFVANGDHIIMTGGAYEPTQDFCNVILKDMNVSTSYYAPTATPEDIASLVQANTKVLFLECPSSITMEVQDIPEIVKAVRAISPEIVIMIDNTWAAGILFPALDYGVDISIQAGTKYIVGHSDAMLGTAVCNERCWDQLRERSYLMGQMVDADTAYVAMRGLRTMLIRLKQHEEASIKVAEWLKAHPMIDRVNHPAIEGSCGHEYWKKYFNGSSGLFSFVLKKKLTPEEYANFLDNFEHFTMAYSWGGFESLILANQPEELNAIRPAGDVDFDGTLVRIHVGLENVNDLIDDLDAGLERIK